MRKTQKIDKEDVFETWGRLLEQEYTEGFRDMSLNLDCHPPAVVKLSTGGPDDLELDYSFSLEKVINDFIQERNGTINLKDESDWLNEWASFFERQSVKLRKQAKRLIET